MILQHILDQKFGDKFLFEKAKLPEPEFVCRNRSKITKALKHSTKIETTVRAGVEFRAMWLTLPTGRHHGLLVVRKERRKPVASWLWVIGTIPGYQQWLFTAENFETAIERQ